MESETKERKKEMPPKKDTGNQEILEQLRILQQQVKNVANRQDEIASLTLEIELLREENARKQERIDSLENRIDQLEQYSKRDDVIISGLKTSHKTYARAADPDKHQREETAPEDELNSLEEQVVEFLESQEITLNKQGISACHVLGKGYQKQPPRIILRFSNRKDKINLLKQGKKLQGTDVFLNEHLTRKNAQIARHAKDLRKSGDVTDTWTRQCAVFVRMKGRSVKKVSNMQDFPVLGLRGLTSRSNSR